MKIILKTIGLCIVFLTLSMSIQAQDTTDTPPKSGDLEFANKATASNNFELQAANIALSKSQDQNIKQYAQMIVDDHTTVGNELATLLKNKNWQLSSVNNQNHSQMIDQLNNADPANFDRIYADMMVKSHQDAITLFKEASNGTATSDVDLRQFAAAKIPAFEKHLEQIKNMQPSNNNTMPNVAPTNPGLPAPTAKNKIPKPTLK